jgi:dipeptidyl aminopeptidase/acylaminoacyl peptidase
MTRAAAIAMVLLSLVELGGANVPPPGPISTAIAGEAAQPPSTATSRPARAKRTPLVEARRSFRSRVARRTDRGEPVPAPPLEIFQLIRYDSQVGKLAAYLTPDPGDGRKHPAIVWITGGDCNSIGKVWGEAPRDNDQNAAAYRKAGIVMMFPALRGGNDNPGQHEGFLGEVDDILAAVDFLARQRYVDPARIYLGGHSTGGTLVMLTAASTDRFRAVFSFGPADDVGGYPAEYIPFDTSRPKEIELRSPGRWLDSVRSPLFVFEGTDRPGNIEALRKMARAPRPT